MSRKNIGSRGSGKSIIRVFCEGETEQAYVSFLKEKFDDVAVIKYPKEVGLFEKAKDRFNKDSSYRDITDVIDEIWFFFDVETKDINKWDERYQIIKQLRKLRKDKKIKVRLLMTSGCIEYWLMLHYKYYTPSLQSVSEKERVIDELKNIEPLYKKGDVEVVKKIASGYPKAIMNAEKTIKKLLEEGLPGIDDTDERNQWLCRNCKTFSTVFEAIRYLECKQSNNRSC